MLFRPNIIVTGGHIERNMEDCFNVVDGEITAKGYLAELLEYLNEHYLSEKTWKKFVDQFRFQTDVDNRWRGEYWGKMLRGAVMVYRCTKDQALYSAMQKTVEDMLSVAEKDERISSYPKEKEFQGWDIWCRKYILLGLLYFYEICASQALKERILLALSKCLDYIIERVGEGEGRICIFRTSNAWGAMNSCSVLEPTLKVYRLTEKEKYLDFAKYIVRQGFCEEENLIEVFLSEKKRPSELPSTKAYEMMSCFQGLLEYYMLTGERQMLQAVQNFAESIYKNEITIIGCAGCSGELFDDAVDKQTEESEEEMQETCVTVTWMNLCFRLLEITGEKKYADCLEISALNALNGSVNVYNQLELQGDIVDYRYAERPQYTGKRNVLPFDSYSPLTFGRRGKKIGGFNVMEDEFIYGCCACIGGLGLAIEYLFAYMNTEDDLAVNLYQSSSFKNEKISLDMTATYSEKCTAVMKVTSDNMITLRLRKPVWTEGISVFVDGIEIVCKEEKGYLLLRRQWRNNEIKIVFDGGVKAYKRKDKIAFAIGPFVLARDEAFGDNLREKLLLNKTSRWSYEQNCFFASDLCVKLITGDKAWRFCDYAHAGKFFDKKDAYITVWSNYTEK